jgi:hypothetical protein
LLPTFARKSLSRRWKWSGLAILLPIVGLLAMWFVVFSKGRHASPEAGTPDTKMPLTKSEPPLVDRVSPDTKAPLTKSEPPLVDRDSPATKAILAKLEKPLSMNFATDTPLSDVMKYIKNATEDAVAGLPGGIPIYVDPIGLQDADKTMADTVMLQLEGVSLKLSLELLLKQVGLSYCAKHGFLFVSTAEKITNWKQSSDEISLPNGDQSIGTRRTLAKLNEPLSMNFATDTPLSDVMKYIQDATRDVAAGLPNGIPIYVDSVSLQEADTTVADTIWIQLEGVPLRYTLKLLLSQNGLTYSILPEGVLRIESLPRIADPKPGTGSGFK